MSVVQFEIESKPRKPLLIADTLLRVFHGAVLENDTGNSAHKHACLTKKNYPVSKPMWNKFTEAAAECDTSLGATMVVIVHQPGNHTCNQYFQFHLKCWSGDSWQAIWRQPHWLQRCCIISNASQKCRKYEWMYLEEPKERYKRSYSEQKKCKVNTDKILKSVKCAENCNETKTCANKSGLEAVDHMYMTQEWLFLSFSILILTLIALVEKLAPNPSSVMLVWYLPDVGSQQ